LDNYGVTPPTEGEHLTFSLSFWEREKVTEAARA